MNGRKKAIRVGLLGVLLLIPASLGFLGYIGLFDGNVRTVVPGKVYRSAQLAPGHLDRLLKERSIRTVISLRGGTLSDRWFRKELEVCRLNQVALMTVDLRATSLPRPSLMRTLLQTLDVARYPVLLHCRSGADRTGLASALYLHSYAGRPLQEAVQSGLSWQYGHFPLSAKPMDDFFSLYRNSGSEKDLRTWIRQDYPVVYHSVIHAMQKEPAPAALVATTNRFSK